MNRLKCNCHKKLTSPQVLQTTPSSFHHSLIITRKTSTKISPSVNQSHGPSLAISAALLIIRNYRLSSNTIPVSTLRLSTKRNVVGDLALLKKCVVDVLKRRLGFCQLQLE